MKSQFKPSTVVSVWTGHSTQLRFKDPVTACGYFADRKSESNLALVSQTDNGYFVRLSQTKGVRFFDSFEEVSRYLGSVLNQD